jgi:hypothetical protein
VDAAEGPVFTVWAGVDDAALDEFLLHPHEYFTRDNGLMAVFHIILRYNAVVLYSSLCKEVGGVCFLQQGKADAGGYVFADEISFVCSLLFLNSKAPPLSDNYL